MTDTNEGKSYMKGCDFLTLPDGSCYHLGTKPGQVHQRILTVGSESRARKIAINCFDNGIEEEVRSNRCMYTFNGHFSGVPISVIAIGMGSPMMDFMIREASYCQPKAIACVRLGTCGILSSAEPGTVMVADQSCYSYVNYGHQAGGHVGTTGEECSSPYFLSKPIDGTPNLIDKVADTLKCAGLVHERGLNVCGETFYACQGRANADFNDENAGITDQFLKIGVSFAEMETHQLYSLCMKRRSPLYTASACIGIVSRSSAKVVTAEDLHRLEVEGGRCCLKTLSEYKLD